MWNTITIEISAGELIDKLTILEIRLNRIREPAKLVNIELEYSLLKAVYDRLDIHSQQIGLLRAKLHEINEALWDIEDDIRDCEHRADFGSEFIRLARAVYKTNDLRSEVKREINIALRSRLVEEKDYRSY